MYRLLLSCLLCVCAYAQTESVDSVITEIFNSTKAPEQSPVRKFESCTTEQNQRGVCVLYFLCDENGYIITNGVGILDIRQRRRRRRSPAEDGVENEKPLNGSLQIPTGSPPSAEDVIDEDFEKGRPLNFIRSKPCSSNLDECCLFPKSLSRPITATHAPSQKYVCGQRQPDGVGFYYKEHATDDAKFAEFPWMVILLRDITVDNAKVSEDSTPARYIGSGSLIHPSIVMTAAHFAINDENKSSYKVCAGIVKAKHFDNELYPHQYRYVVDVKVHEEYDKNTLTFDVALLFLASPMIMAPNVGVVCLAPQTDYSFPRSNCIGSGWGKDKYGSKGKYRTRMKKFNLKLIDHDICQQQLQKTRLGLFFELHSSFTCADDDLETDTCQGDGGSPVVCPIAGESMRYQQHGIVSWGIGCGNTGIPTVYVDVSKVRSWIDGAVVAKGLDPKVYTP